MPMSGPEIIAMLEETQRGYACQDNVDAAKASRILLRCIALAKGEEIEADTRPVTAEFGTPSIEELRAKYLGTAK